ncbi:dTMP kinase [Oscillatoria sp. CS-180]|uniref:dTMP kinase n=1 Tax=Oscillatoria sp. CS-180 TaxID=3021720 RepID=UPI00232D8EAD|nr:dTMP kinase [Oscillatoria sp. CS-180]MDB9528101.1 dTMP kinase [Oscillatoria sp. CS-180]
MQGKLIVFEGVEGSGKSTQLLRLERWLTQHPTFQTLQSCGAVPEIIVTREPGGTELGKSLRNLLLNHQDNLALGARAELMLYAADRSQHIEELILPALKAGSWVLCDRFIDSTVAYQGFGRGLSLSLIENLNHIATQGITGNLTFWLQLDAAQGLARSRSRGQLDRMEQASMDFHRQVQQGFETLAEQYPGRIISIDAAQSEEGVALQVQTVMEQHLKIWYGKHFQIY